MRKKRPSLDDAFDENDVCAPPNNPALSQIPNFDEKHSGFGVEKGSSHKLWAAIPESGTPTTGIKYDMEKPDYSLVPPNALDDTVKILTLGAQKYDRDNWKQLKGAKRRYFAAAMRHMWARLRGELTDPESGLDHCAHAICCLMFILELEHLKLDP